MRRQFPNAFITNRVNALVHKSTAYRADSSAVFVVVDINLLDPRLVLGSAAPGVILNFPRTYGTEEAGGVKQKDVRVSRIDVGLLGTTITRKSGRVAGRQNLNLLILVPYRKTFFE